MDKELQFFFFVSGLSANDRLKCWSSLMLESNILDMKKTIKKNILENRALTYIKLIRSIKHSTLNWR